MLIKNENPNIFGTGGIRVNVLPMTVNNIGLIIRVCGVGTTQLI